MSKILVILSDVNTCSGDVKKFFFWLWWNFLMGFFSGFTTKSRMDYHPLHTLAV